MSRLKMDLKFLLTFILLVSAVFAFGQDSNQVQSSASKSEKSVIIGMYYDLSSVGQIPMHNIGGRSAVVLNDRWLFGGFAQGNLALNFDYKYLGLPARIYTGQGGLWFGRFILPEKQLNLALSAWFGGGVFGSEVRLSKEGEELRTADAYNTEFFQCAPQVDVFVKILPYVKLSANLGYRFTLGMKYNPVVNNAQMNSVFTQVGFTLGPFKD